MLSNQDVKKLIRFVRGRSIKLHLQLNAIELIGKSENPFGLKYLRALRNTKKTVRKVRNRLESDVHVIYTKARGELADALNYFFWDDYTVGEYSFPPKYNQRRGQAIRVIEEAISNLEMSLQDIRLDASAVLSLGEVNGPRDVSESDLTYRREWGRH